MPTELVTDLVGTSLAPVDAPRAFLVVHVDLPDRGSTVIDLHDGVDVTFGRSRGAVVTVDHASVSRLHARVRRTGDVIELEDLGSRNGTFVNNEPCPPNTPVKIEPGSTLVVGGVTFQLIE